MPSFMCADNHDEKLLIEILSSFTSDNRPAIVIRPYAERVHDISGTLDRIREANLRSMYDILAVDSVPVQCLLIDDKQIEATILVENFAEAKRIWQSGVLKWPTVTRKVRRVLEGWTRDGSNIKFDPIVRLYTSDDRPTRYFRTDADPNVLNDDMDKTHGSMTQQMRELNELKEDREKVNDQLEKVQRNWSDERQKLQSFTQVRSNGRLILSDTLIIAETTRPRIRRCRSDERFPCRIQRPISTI